MADRKNVKERGVRIFEIALFFFALIALIDTANALVSSPQYWSYYRPITITNNVAQDLTDYQVNFTLDTANLIAQGKMRSDCGDLRVTQSDGQTLLPYWIEPNTCNTNTTRIWTKVPSISASSSVTIYVWYGNPQATSQANGSAVFDFFDDFDDGVVDTSKWDVGTSTYNNYVLENNGLFASNTDTGISANENSVSGYYRIYGTGTVDLVTEDGVPAGWLGKGLRSVKTFDLSKGIVIETSVYLYSYSLGSQANRGVAFGLATAQDKDNRVEFIWSVSESGSGLGYTKEEAGTRSIAGLVGGSLNAGQTYRFIYKKDTANNFYGSVGSLSGSITSTFNSTTARVGLFAYVRNIGDSIDVRWDWFFVRKYASAEPSVSVGSEISTGDVYDESNGNAILSANFTIVTLNSDYSINSTMTLTNQPALTSLTPGFYYITASANNYYERALLINFTGSEKFSFYLPPSSSSVYVTFTVFDPSSTFYTQGSRLKLMTNTSTVIDVRFLDTSHRAVMPLILGKLYVVALENDQQSRVVGFVSATSTSITLYVNQLNITVANYAPVIWNCTQNSTIQCAWQTTAGNTSGAKLTIYDVNGNVVTTMTASTPNGSFTYLQPNTTYRFVFQVFNDLQNVTYSFTNFNWTAPITPPTPNYFNTSAIPQFDIKSVPSEYRLMFFGGLALIVTLFFRRSHVPVGLALSLGIVVLCVVMGFLELDRNLILVLAIIVGLSFFELERERGAG